MSNKETNATVISIVTGSKIVRVALDDVEAIEQDGRKIHIMTGKDDFACYGSLDAISKEILENKVFYQPMKKLIINFDKIKEISDGEILFESGASLCMGKNKFSETKRFFKEYLSKYPNEIIAGSAIAVYERREKTEEK